MSAPLRAAARWWHRWWRRWRDEAGIAALLVAWAAALALGGWAWRLDRLGYDLGLMLWRRPPPPGIVIVAIDDASIGAIGRWPWPRAVTATLLERLAHARPRAVALDLVLSEPDPNPAEDRLLAAALSDAAPVVLPLSWVPAAGGGPPTLLEPAPLLRGAARLGTAEAPVDADGVLRSAFLRAGPAGALRPHMALALMQAAGEAVHPGLPTASGPAGAGAWRREDRFLLRYPGPPGTVDRVPALDLLRGHVPDERLTGRYVLVGMTAQGLGDTLATPVNGRHQAMPGVEVLADTLYTLRSGDTLRALPAGSTAAVSAALLVGLIGVFGRFGPRVALPAALASVPLVVMASLLALGAGWWLSPVPYALSAVLAYPLWSWRRLERAVIGLDAEIARLDADPLPVGEASAGSPPDDIGDAIGARLQTLQRAGRLLRQARRFLADALAAMPTAMLVADAGSRVLLANPEAAALFEVDDAQELQGLSLVRLLAEFRTPEAFDWDAAIAGLESGRSSLAVEGQLAGGADCVIHLAAVDRQGQRLLIVGIADIEPVKQAEREREEALAFVSHDLRSPASSIVILADMHLQGAAPPPDAALLREMRRLAEQTLAMSEDFVRTSQVRRQALQAAPVALGALIEDCVADLRAQARASGVGLRPALAPGHAATAVVVDRGLVSRAIGNLLSNAIRHSPPGASVELQVQVHGARLQVVVCDSGPGLSAAQRAELSRGDFGLATGHARGLGLGLLFVQRVARRHAGTLRAGTSADGGARFELEIALVAPAGPGT